MATNSKPTVVSTFAGTGGSSLGYKWAGFKEFLAIDFDEDAVTCFKENFPDVPVWHKSVSDVTGQEILDFCGIKVGELDVFDGSPPCQGFSTSGKRQVTDPRNDLFLQYWRLVKELQPKVFVMENVPGMARGVMKGKFLEILKTLKSENYVVSCKKMNSKFYGVPQARERLIFIGVRKDLKKIPVFPMPSNKITTVRQALVGIEPSERFELTDKYGLLWNKIPYGKNASMFLNGSGFNNCVKVHPDRPAMTLSKTQGTKGFGTMVHWAEPRPIAINEALRLCSFPDDWKFGSLSYEGKWARLGNAVMPKFMQAIAETIKNEILIESPTQP